MNIAHADPNVISSVIDMSGTHIQKGHTLIVRNDVYTHLEDCTKGKWALRVWRISHSLKNITLSFIVVILSRPTFGCLFRLLYVWSE